MPRLTFTLDGRDELSRVLNGTADSADHLRLRMAGLTTDADGNLRDLQGRYVSVADAQRRLAGDTDDTARRFRGLTDASSKLGDSLKSGLISLAPAAIPLVAGLGGAAAAVGAQLGAAGVAAGAFALALGPQISAISKARDAQNKYEEAVKTSGRTSQAAAEAESAYRRELAQLPPETRKAAVAVGLLADGFSEWSDSLSGDVMAPFIKGVGVANTLLPKTTGLVKGSSTELDRLITMLGGAVASPGFDALNDKFTVFANDTMRNAVDEVAMFFDRLERGEVDDSGLQRFLDYCRDNAPLAIETLNNLGDAAFNLIEAGSGVGVGMLDLINFLAGVASAVPPGAIATLLQLAIAVKAVRLAAAGSAAAGAAMAGLAGQIALARAAAAAAPGPLAATTAAIGALSRTAKLAVAGTAIGLLLIGLTELASRGQKAGPDVDRLTTSLGQLAVSGKVSGEAARAYGKDLGGLADSLREVARPSNVASFQQWATQLVGLDSTPVKEAKKDLDGIDKALANMVSSGNADQAEAAFNHVAAAMKKKGLTTAELRAELGDYKAALAGAAFEEQLAAESMGLFGAQAIDVQAKLDTQKQSADGLAQSIHALNNSYLTARGGVRGMEAAIDAASESLKKNGATLDNNTEKGRANNAALDELASATMKAAESSRANGASWDEVSGIYDRGRGAFLRSAQAMGLTETQARKLADQILKTPNKTAYLRGDLDDLRAKLADAKERLRKAPSSKTAAIKGEISDLKRKIAAAERELDRLDGKTAYTYVRTVYSPKGHTGPGGIPAFARGGPIQGFPGGGLLQGPGTSTSDSILLRGSNGEYMVNAMSVRKYGLDFMHAINDGTLPAGRAAAPAGRPAAALTQAAPAGDQTRVTYNVYPRQSVISAEDLLLIQRQEEARQRVGRPG
ncbi:hypothetical protein [Streptomyces sp. NPDC058665]|uniref:hypothetical protein n=1 Tax=Streptomyces sp. NPDC058665 TaxID=3346586 RepID=UPI00365333DB